MEKNKSVDIDDIDGIAKAMKMIKEKHWKMPLY